MLRWCLCNRPRECRALVLSSFERTGSNLKASAMSHARPQRRAEGVMAPGSLDRFLPRGTEAMLVPANVLICSDVPN